MNRKNLTFIFLGMLIAIYTAAGFFVLPGIIKPLLIRELGSNLKRPVTIEGVYTNPYMLSAKIEGIEVQNRDGSGVFSSLEVLYINFQLSSVLKRSIVLKEIALVNPYIKIVRNKDGTFNLSDLIHTKGQQDKDRAHGFSLSNISVSGGKIEMADKIKNTLHSAADIDISLPFISNTDKDIDEFIHPALHAFINNTHVKISGHSKPFKDTVETSLAIDLKGLDLPYYTSYLPEDIKISVPGGSLDIRIRTSYIRGRGSRPEITLEGSISIRELDLRDNNNEPIIALPSAKITLDPSMLISKRINIARIEVNSPELNIIRLASGKINISETVIKNTAPGPKTGDEKTKPLLNIREIAFKNGKIGFTDNTLKEPAHIECEGLAFNAHDISTETGRTGVFEIETRINNTGILRSKASIGLNPIKASMDMEMEGIAPGWFQSYLIDRINIIITGGTTSIQGTALVEQRSDKSYRIIFKGDSLLSDFASIDRANADDFIRLKGLRLEGIEAGINPDHISIDLIKIDKPYSKITLNPGNTLNITEVIQSGTKDTSPPKTAEKDRAIQITVKDISLKDGHVNFTDSSIEPNYSSDLSDITGELTGLNSAEGSKADIKLSGTLDKHARLDVSGKINPLGRDVFADIGTRINDVDLSPMSPYAGKYTGYTLKKGKISLDLKYLVDKKMLDSTNEVFIDQLTFGDVVESEDAVDLPVKLAVSLLKDTDEKINIHLPVKGRTDDPEFSVIGIIIKMLRNLIAKAATSPFGLLDALYPGASELSSIDFEYGRSVLPDGLDKRLGILSKILSDKPSLSLEITGFSDPYRDRVRLKELAFEKKLKAQKLRDMLSKGSKATDLDNIIILPEEYEHHLKKAYQDEGFAQITPDADREEMKRQILGNIYIDDSALRLLAGERAAAIKDFFISTYHIDPKRIFLVETDETSPAKTEGMTDARVELSLR